MNVTKPAIDLIKEFEGFRSAAYKDAVGVWTIGYGTTAMAKVGIEPRAGLSISEAQATEYLMRAVDKFAASIHGKMTREPTPDQFGAMVSLAYNIGPGAFAKSTVLRKFNAGDIQGAADAFRMWNKAGGKVLAGLTRRREAERSLFLSRTPQTAAPHVAKPVSAPTPSWITALVALFRALFIKGPKA